MKTELTKEQQERLAVYKAQLQKIAKGNK